MSLRCRDARRRLAAGLLLAGATAFARADDAPAPAPAPAPTAAPALRVCGDPDNLPYSHVDGSGFENRIAQLMADELGRPLAWFWLPLRRGFVRKTLGAGECDLLVGVPADLERVLATRPYYRSGYVFVTRVGDAAPLHSFDDPRLARLRIGVQLIGNDLAATPPGHALARRGATERVIGYTVYGDGPAAERMLRALADGRLDAALVWGPQAGYFVQRAAVPLQVWPAARPADSPEAFEFAIAMGVRRGDAALRDALDAAIDRRRPEIDRILADYGVPRSDRSPAPQPERKGAP